LNGFNFYLLLVLLKIGDLQGSRFYDCADWCDLNVQPERRVVWMLIYRE
jgi:hypothetical protein